MKKILGLIMAAAVAASMQVATFAEAEPQIKVDGRSVTFRDEQAPIIRNDRLYVPVRRVLETMDAKVNWKAETKTVEVSSFDNVTILKLQIDNPIVTRYEYTSVLHADKTEIESDVAPIIENDRTMLPIRVIAEALGATVYYEEDTKITYITTKQAKRKITSAGMDATAEDVMIADLYKENLPKVSIECDAEDVKEGDTVKVKIKLADLEKYAEDAKLCSITASIEYDKNNFAYDGFVCVVDGEEKMPMMHAENGEFTDKLVKIVTLETTDSAVVPGDVIAILEFTALNDNGGEFALSDGRTDIGNNTELLFVSGENIETLSEYTELYIDTTPVTVK